MMHASGRHESPNAGLCTLDCQVARYGDGYVRAGAELCDDGNANQCGTCNATCQASMAGGNCPVGVGCLSNADCASNFCLNKSASSRLLLVIGER